MNPNIPYTAFLHNPAIWEELCRYCESLPNYAQTYGEFRCAMGKAEQVLDHKLYLELERTMNALRSLEDEGGLLFGLGLRRELLYALGG